MRQKIVFLKDAIPIELLKSGDEIQSTDNNVLKETELQINSDVKVLVYR